MGKPDDLSAYIFDRPLPFSREVKGWMETSPRYTLFVETYKDKIRKKLRVIRENESALDVRAELRVACCLLQDRRFELVYEPFASAKHRGPDFSATYRANLTFNIEVGRMHIEAGEPGEIQPGRTEARILKILFSKLGQMQPGMTNLLVISAPDAAASAVELAVLMQALKTRVEGKDPAFYAASGFASPAEFYKEFLHLSGMILWAREAQSWANKQARTLLDEKVLRLVSTLLSAEQT